jgi:putative flippase GtrA
MMHRALSKSAQFLRYAFVGIASNAIGYFVYLFFTGFGTGPKVTMTGLYCIGAGLGFIGHRQITFRHKGSIPRSIVIYLFAHLIGYGINFSMLYFLSDKLLYPHQWVQAFAVVVVAIYLFLSFKYLVFPSLTTEEKD